MGNSEMGVLNRGYSHSSASVIPIDVHTSSIDPTALSGVAAISSSSYRTCAIFSADRSVKCWGDQSNGQLISVNNHIISINSTPAAPHANSSPLTNIETISFGSGYTCVLTTNGNVKCWGYGSGDYEQLGNGQHGSFDSIDPQPPQDIINP